MAHHTEQTGFPPIPLNGGMIVRLRALSPTTDVAVTGVTSTNWAIYGLDQSVAVEPDVIPALTPEEVAEWV